MRKEEAILIIQNFWRQHKMMTQLYISHCQLCTKEFPKHRLTYTTKLNNYSIKVCMGFCWDCYRKVLNKFHKTYSRFPYTGRHGAEIKEWCMWKTQETMEESLPAFQCPTHYVCRERNPSPLTPCVIL